MLYRIQIKYYSQTQVFFKIRYQCYMFRLNKPSSGISVKIKIKKTCNIHCWLVRHVWNRKMKHTPIVITLYSETSRFWKRIQGTKCLNFRTCKSLTMIFQIAVFFTIVPFISIQSKFYYQLMHKIIALKILKFTLKQLQQVSVLSPSSGSVQFELVKLSLFKQSINLHWCAPGLLLMGRLITKLITY